MVRSVLLVAFAVWALWLVVGNALVATPLLKKLVSNEQVVIEYTRAWTLFPGRVHVRNLRVRVEDSQVQVLVAMDRVALSVDLPALVARQLVMRDVRAEGVSFKARMRVFADELDPAALEGIPPIDGLPEVPLRHEKKRKLLRDEDYRLWTVHLRDLVADPVREVWIGPYRFHGDARVEGGFYLRPLRKVSVGPARAEIRSGGLDLEKRPFAVDPKGTIECTIAMHDPRAVDGAEMFRFVDAAVTLESRVDDFAFAQRWLEKSGVTLTGGAGSARASLAMRGGVLLPGSRMELAVKNVLARSSEGSVGFDLRAALDTEKAATMTVVATDVTARRRWAESWPITAKTVSAVARSTSLDFANRPFDDLLASLDLPHAEVTDVRAFRDLAKSTELSASRASLSAHLDLSAREKLLQGEAKVSSDALALKLFGASLVSKVTAGAKVEAFDFDAMTARLTHASIDLRDLKVDDEVASWWGTVTLANGALDPKKTPAFGGALAFHLRDARPIVHVYDAKKGLPDWAKPLLSLDGLEGSARLEAGPQLFAVRDLRAHGGGLHLFATYARKGDETSGSLGVKKGPLSVQIPVAGGAPTVSVGGGPKTD